MDKITLTTKYAEGELSINEQLLFEKNITIDHELQEYLAHYKKASSNLGGQISELLKNNIQNRLINNPTNTVYLKERLDFKLDNLWYLAWFLTFAIALMLIRPWEKTINEQFGINNKYISEEIANAPFENFSKAAQFIEDKDFYNAKLIVAKTYYNNPKNIQLGIYYATLLIGDKKFETVKEIITPIAKGSSNLKYKAAYLLALCYANEQSNAMAKQWLLQIPQSAKNYQNAQIALNKLSTENDTFTNSLAANYN